MDYSKLTVEELKQIISNLGLDIPQIGSGLNKNIIKQDLIDLISQHKCKGEEWYKREKINVRSEYAEIWRACCHKDCNYILKYQSFEQDEFGPKITPADIKNEVKIQNEISKFGLCPKVEDYWISKTGGTIVMKALKFTVRDIIKKYVTLEVRLEIILNVLNLILKLHNKGYAHGDMHLNNMMVDFDVDDYEKANKYTSEIEQYKKINYKYFFIDMGMTKRTNNKKIYKDDFERVYDDIEFMLNYEKVINKQNLVYLLSIINLLKTK